ncbi:MAG: hypothetical protein V1790_18385 [Planctomycetota bacterium]
MPFRLNTAWLALTVIAAAARGQTQTLSVDLKLRTGGALSGLVVDHSEHALVIVRDRKPYVFSWSELEFGSAFIAKRALLELERGGPEKLSAEDAFELGRFALAHDRNDVAAQAFRDAERLNAKLTEPIRRAFEEYRRRKAATNDNDDLFKAEPSAPLENPTDEAVADVGNSMGVPELDDTVLAAHPSPETRTRVMEAYRTFGEKVREVMGKDVALVETDHFLIWTDWEKKYRDRLTGWAEAMYAALGEQFNLKATDGVFLAKCPVYCWRSKARFQKFARYFDGYGGSNAVGYSRSIEKNGHVHVVLLRQGLTGPDFDRFASTLVHEGSHAFLHRLYSTRLIPHWVNEGYAELIAERVLGEHCDAAEKAALLARQYVRYDWPLAGMLESTAPIEVYEYPLAHSLVAHLESLGRQRFAGFIRSLKEGRTTAEALGANYHGMSLEGLEASWRAAIRAADASSQVKGTR